jgi:predicted nucleotidyltransferase
MQITIGELEKEELERATRILLDFGAEGVWLFGSIARGEHGADWDFAVKGIPPEKFYSALSELMDVLSRPVDLVDMDENRTFIVHLSGKPEFVRVA